jgi:hypothetical protein
MTDYLLQAKRWNLFAIVWDSLFVVYSQYFMWRNFYLGKYGMVVFHGLATGFFLAFVIKAIKDRKKYYS